MNNQITARLVDKVPWWNFEEIKTKVNQEYDAWWEVAREKRLKLKQYMKDYNVNWDDMKAGEFVKSKSLYTNRNLFISALYKNKPEMTFEWRKVGDIEYADTWNNLLKFDYEELQEDKIEYEKISNKVDFWIYLAVSEWWDKVTETPKKRLINPLCWIPDPYFDQIRGFSFHWFELKLTECDLNDLYQNKNLMLTDEELKTLKENSQSEDIFLTRLSMWNDWEGIGNEWEHKSSPLNTYSIYRHFTKFNNRWYLTEWANNRTLLVRLEMVKAVRAEEKADPTKIPCPVVHSWFIPKPWDPYWLCVWDIGRDNQFTEEQVLNLLINKTNEEVFSGITLFDPTYINGNELAKKKVGKRKYIPAKMPINTKVIDNIQTQTNSSAEWYQLKQLIDAKSTKEIWFDEQSVWVYARRLTATQSQLLQGNQNVRLATIFKTHLWWERDYWDVLWYRQYQENFKMDSKKNIILNTGLGTQPFTVMAKDLNTKADLKLKPVSLLDKQEKDEEERGAYMAAYQMLMQQATPFGQIQLTKKFARVLWMDKELVNSIYKNPPEVEQALLDVELLNNNEEVGEIQNMNENHQIFIEIYQQALDTPAKEKAIAARKRALLLQLKQEAGQLAQPWMEEGMVSDWGAEWGVNNMSNMNQLINNYIQQQNSSAKQPTVLWTNVP